MEDFALVRCEPAVVRGRDRFDAITITMHWCSLFLLALIAFAAWRLGRAADADAAAGALSLHRSAGVLLWLLTLARLGWKASFARPAELPTTVSRPQRFVARATQWALYVLLVLQPATGFLQSVLRGRPFPLLGLTFPMVASRDRALVKLFHGAHEFGAWALLALVGLHAGAALFHHFALQDRVLRAMLPELRRSGRSRRADR